MATLVKREELRVLLPLLESNLPYSLSVKCMIQLLLDGKHPDQFNVWTDSLVCPSAVVICGDKPRCTNKFYRKIMLLYGSNAESLTSILNNGDVLDSSEPIYLYGIPKHFLHQVSVSTRLKEMKLKNNLPAKIFEMNAEDLLQERSLPDGFYADCLTTDLCDTVTSHWKYASPGVPDTLRDVIISGLPTVCVFNQQNEPVAWALQRQFGFVGILHVKDEYRGQGLGKYVLSELANKVIRRDKAVYVELTLDNEISRKLHERIGFKNRCTDIFSYILYIPKGEENYATR